MKTLEFVAIVLVALAGFSGAASAQTTVGTATFDVTTTVPLTCQVSGGSGIAFPYDPNAETTATTTISVLCDGDGNIKISLDGGLHYGSGGVGRRMADTAGTAFLQYSLRQPDDATRWGDSVDPILGDVLTDTIVGGTQVLYTVNGHLPGNQGATPGGYSDTVTLTVLN